MGLKDCVKKIREGKKTVIVTLASPSKTIFWDTTKTSENCIEIALKNGYELKHSTPQADGMLTTLIFEKKV